MKIKVRKLTPNHRKTIARLLVQYWKKRGIKSTLSWAQQYLIKGHALEITREQFFEIRDGSRVIGVISAIIWYHRLAELRDLVVLEEYRGRGTGKKVIRETEKWCKKQKVKKIHCKILPRHWKWFRTLGYKKEGLLKNHFADGENVIVIGKELKK